MSVRVAVILLASEPLLSVFGNLAEDPLHIRAAVEFVDAIFL